MWSEPLHRLLHAGLWLAVLSGPAAAEQPSFGFGRPATQAEIDAWDIDVRADGRGLPPGRGSVQQGEALFAAQCESCHPNGGSKALSPNLDTLVGGRATPAAPNPLTTANPLKTIGSYWPYPTTLFDYIRRAMPFNAPQSLTADDVYALSAYLLHRNGVLAADAVLDADSLAKITMPNHDGFIDRDDWQAPSPR